MVAVSTNLKLVKEFGINTDNAFGFWDWVGGRYSVCSAVGVLPLALTYGFDISEQFLSGANSMDDHFKSAPLGSNLPVLMGLTSLWNISFLGYPARAILPYCQVGEGARSQASHGTCYRCDIFFFIGHRGVHIHLEAEDRYRKQGTADKKSRLLV